MPLLKLEGIRKGFDGTPVLHGVDFEVHAGEVHALCGENGAGKSTLMKIMSGVYQPDGGSITFRGDPVKFPTTQVAEGLGIVIIHQELNLIPHLSVAENIYLAREPRRGWFIDRARLRADAQRCLDRLGVNIGPDALVKSLSVAQQQMVEIAKALSMNATVLIMDEPTSSLTESETTQLFKVIHELKAGGVGVVYISHRLDEMAQIVDRVTVLRDGRCAGCCAFAETTVDGIVAMMVGRALEDKFPPRTRQSQPETILEVRDLHRRSVFAPVSFDLQRGEILGFAGLMGAGRTEVARALFGADPKDGGSVRLHGEELAIRSPSDAIRQGIAYVSEDRKADGLAVKMTVAQNITLAHMGAVCGRAGFVDSGAETAAAQHFIQSLGIRTSGPHQVARLLSGGNQQKVAISKWLFRQARVIIFDEPTRGIDVGAKYSIYELMDRLAAEGVGVILISSELPEIMGLTDRVAVFHEGRLTRVLRTQDTHQEEIMHYASGCGTAGATPAAPPAPVRLSDLEPIAP
ncbi:sugar ABC transporter ATP-binding protein [Paracidovorax avenae]|uniref:sugar ABC transporter ATP-binding protein n=1 Tax=Paracidovorax avenae TaxID=80867 RepID=UPI000D218473|nr:sugar ABC transporter ATP-binding protein [Paracidovorax avenae]AVS95637.1 D-xylose ABC transporter ATP-binding protein [Paracidovorax avenae]AVT02308.1 D-xylose ABC transporter ATP-binding protein [Paracidovorax avenae]AVT09214.1 D-xylose ABC transporter ATP-binding protein [Paracidovorax avenae]